MPDESHQMQDHKMKFRWRMACIDKSGMINLAGLFGAGQFQARSMPALFWPLFLSLLSVWTARLLGINRLWPVAMTRLNR